LPAHDRSSGGVYLRMTPLSSRFPPLGVVTRPPHPTPPHPTPAVGSRARLNA
jgi:hypothetical protein